MDSTEQQAGSRQILGAVWTDAQVGRLRQSVRRTAAAYGRAPLDVAAWAAAWQAGQGEAQRCKP